jgi:hypothetical protein
MIWRQLQSLFKSGCGLHFQTHFGDGLADPQQQCPHIRLEYSADRTNSETIRVADFSRVNDESFVAQSAIKFIERKSQILWEIE